MRIHRDLKLRGWSLLQNGWLELLVLAKLRLSFGYWVLNLIDFWIEFICEIIGPTFITPGGTNKRAGLAIFYPFIIFFALIAIRNQDKGVGYGNISRKMRTP